MHHRLFPLALSVLASAREHRLTTHATAIAYRVLVALVPLAILAVGLLSVFGLEDVWTDSVAPAVKQRFTAPVFSAIDYSVGQIFRSSKPWLIAFALALLLWEATRAVRAVSNALNEIHETDEQRPRWRVTVVTLALAVAVSGLIIAATLTMVVGGRIGIVAVILRWPLAIVFLGLAVALLLRYATSDHPEPRWASAGSAAIVFSWLLLSLGFGYWVAAVANYKSAAGVLLAFLILTTYVLASAAVFIAGAELDELLRTRKR